MFDDLRRTIRTLTRERKSPKPQAVLRSIFFAASPQLAHIHELFGEWWPASVPDLESLCPWLPAAGSEDFAAQATTVIKNSFNAALLQRLSRNGMSVLHATNQVVVMIDLSDANTCGQIEGCCEAVQQALSKLETPDTFFDWIGILVVRECPLAGAEESGTKALEALAPLLCERFSRLFLLDNRNTQGAALNPTDQEHLILHLLHFLSTFHAALNDEQEYAEWLRRGRAAEGYICGAGGCSVVLPIDEIMEAVMVYRGAEIVRESLLHESSDGRSAFYFNNLVQQAAITGLSDLANALGQHPEACLQNPFAALPKRATTGDAEWLDLLSDLDARLPRVAADNQRRMEQVGTSLLQEWKHTLEDHLEAAVTCELGGLVVRGSSLKN